MTDHLYRHPTDRVIAGVAGGMAVWLNVDPSLVRVAWVLLALLSGAAFVIVYLVMMIVVPLPPAGWVPRPRGATGPGPGAVPGWQPGGAWPPPETAGPAGTSPEARTPGWSAPASGSGWAPSSPSPDWPASPPAPARQGSAGIIAGIVLVVLGIWFLVDQYVRIDWDVLWPVVIMVAGGALIAWAVLRGRSG